MIALASRPAHHAGSGVFLASPLRAATTIPRRRLCGLP